MSEVIRRSFSISKKKCLVCLRKTVGDYICSNCSLMYTIKLDLQSIVCWSKLFIVSNKNSEKYFEEMYTLYNNVVHGFRGQERWDRLDKLRPKILKLCKRKGDEVAEDERQEQSKKIRLLKKYGVD
ncbi:hypothetical protein HQ529_03505 [Candidatus Woesearchaeota archaeon]|nr:hypothetical protein [Candidatus Woesearchaeota archaeon]